MENKDYTVTVELNSYKPISIEGSLVRVDFVDLDDADEPSERFLTIDVSVRNNSGEWEPAAAHYSTVRTQVKASTCAGVLKDLLLSAYEAYTGVITSYPCEVSLKSVADSLMWLGA